MGSPESEEAWLVSDITISVIIHCVWPLQRANAKQNSLLLLNIIVNNSLNMSKWRLQLPFAKSWGMTRHPQEAPLCII